MRWRRGEKVNEVYPPCYAAVVALTAERHTVHKEAHRVHDLAAGCGANGWTLLVEGREFVLANCFVQVAVEFVGETSVLVR